MDKCDIAGFEKEKGGGVIGRGFGKRRGKHICFDWRLLGEGSVLVKCRNKLSASKSHCKAMYDTAWASWKSEKIILSG